MSVIAKFYVNGSTAFNAGVLVDLSAIAENRFMAMYAYKSDEDILFTKASPSGSCRMQAPSDPQLEPGDQLYFVFVRGEKPDVSRALAWASVRIASVTDYGGTTKHFEITQNYRDRRGALVGGEMQGFSFKIGIDNPGAFRQFEVGQVDWWVLAFKAIDITADEAIAFAHTPPSVTEEALAPEPAEA